MLCNRDATLSNTKDSRYKPIEDYGIIGNLRTVALVGIDASIDFMYFPHFASPTQFLLVCLTRKKVAISK